MEPVTLVAAAIAAGAAVGLTGTASRAVTDAYQALRNLVSDKYHAVNLQGVEQHPLSGDRRAELAGELERAEAGDDPELLAAARHVLIVVGDHAPRTVETVGVALREIRAGEVEISDITSAGHGVIAEQTSVDGSLRISGVRAGEEGQPLSSGAVLDTPAAVSLTGVVAGEDISISAQSTHYIYNYYGTVSAGVAPTPLIAVSGEIESPYRGLGWFTDRDAALFFGRDSAIETVWQRLSECLTQPGLLVVSGVSGAGKTSLLRAGLLPRIAGLGLVGAPNAHRWPRVVLTPGRCPLDELALAAARLSGADVATVRRELRTDPTSFALTAAQVARGPEVTPEDRRLLLVVDQFEQLFTQCSDPDERRAFVTALHAAATTGHGAADVPAAVVVLVVRADFEARCGDYEDLSEAIQNRYLVTAMTERQLRLAITEPAKRAGARIDDDLTEQLLREIRTHTTDSSVSATVVSGAGVLPLLSHALDRAWRTRTGDTVTVADYERTGGIERAVAASAQRAYDGLTDAQQSLTRRIFTRLTVTGADGTDTSDRVPRAGLATLSDQSTDIDAVLEAFAAQRLLTMAADTVEISHEVLLTAWPLLRDTWLAETHDTRVVRARLHTVAVEWDRHARDRAYLYSRSVLRTANTIAARIADDPARYPPLDDIDRCFLAVSTRAQRRRIWLAGAVIGAVMVLIVALTMTLVKVSRDSIRQRDVAVARELISRSELLSTTDPFGSRLAALAAWHIDPTPASRYAMLAAIRNPFAGVLLGHSDVVWAVQFSPDGKIVATASDDRTIRLWDTASRRQIGEPLTGHTEGVTALSFSPDGKTLASGSYDRTVRLWDVATRQPIGEPLTGHTRGVHSLSFNPGGTILAAAGDLDKVRLWDVAAHRQLGEPLTGHTGWVDSIVFSPGDGAILATGGADKTVRLWDVATARPIGEALTGHTGAVYLLEFTADGKYLGSYGSDNLRLWDVATGHPFGEPAAVYPPGKTQFASSPPDPIVATANVFDEEVQLWDARSHRQVGAVLPGHIGGVDDLTFSPDGRILATGGNDGAVRLWNISPRLPQVDDPTGANIALMVTGIFSPNASTLVSLGIDQVLVADAGSMSRLARVWDVPTGKPIGDLSISVDMVQPVAFSPDGTILVTFGDDKGTVRLWDMATLQPIGERLDAKLSGSFASPDGKTRRVIMGAGVVVVGASVAFSPDGKIFATGGDGSVRLWDVATRQQIGEPLTGHTGLVSTIAFSPDGTTLATGGADETVRLWDVATHRPIGEPLTGHTAAVAASAFTPDGSILATAGGEDRTVRLWDVATRKQLDAPLTGFTESVFSVTFGPDGKTLVTSGVEPVGVEFETSQPIPFTDQIVRIWDVATGRPIGDSLPGHTVMIVHAGTASMVFRADGRELISTSMFYGLVRWDLGFLSDPAATLCAEASGTFTEAQWKRYVPAGPSYRELCS